MLVNNAGILRDRMLMNMSLEEWDVVSGPPSRHVFHGSAWSAEYWRERSKAGLPNDARIINTSSASGLYGNAGQTNYGAAKAGIAAFRSLPRGARPLRRDRQCLSPGAPPA